MKWTKQQDVNVIFQRVKVNEHLPQPVQEMETDDNVFVTGCIKYKVDFIEDIAKECSGEVERGDGFMKLTSEDYAVYVDVIKELVYVTGATLAFINSHRDKIAIYV